MMMIPRSFSGFTLLSSRPCIRYVQCNVRVISAFMHKFTFAYAKSHLPVASPVGRFCYLGLNFLGIL